MFIDNRIIPHKAGDPACSELLEELRSIIIQFTKINYRRKTNLDLLHCKSHFTN